MISSEKYNTVKIQITTFKGKISHKDQLNMNEEKRNSKNNNKFICSCCLNNKIKNSQEESRTIKCLSVPRSCKFCSDKDLSKDDKHKSTAKDKAVQTLQTDLSTNLNLLNEVLTVFQNKRQIDIAPKPPAMLKDAAVCTDEVWQIFKPKLRVSKVFQFSTDEINIDRDNRFTVITSHEDITKSIDLPKQKSHSIPQMKLEELKNLLREKTKSKDAVEEVNRMFATVKNKYNTNDHNRPLTRNGPRILPVVNALDRLSSDNSEMNSDHCNNVCHCKCCQTGDCLSSGDSFGNYGNCRSKRNQTEKCDKCVYMMCCQLKNCHKMRNGVVYYCENCREEWKFRSKPRKCAEDK